MSRMFHNWIVTPSTEIIAMGVLGMCFTALEDSFFNIKALLDEVWNMSLPSKQFSPHLQYAIKTILSTVVVARTYTVHAFFLTYILLIYVAFFEERPRLLIPWLLLGAIRNLILDSLAITTGVFICVWSAGMTPVCMEFLARKSLKLAISFYLWRSVLKLYWELFESKCSLGEPSPTDSLLELEIAARRRKARSLPDDYEGKSSWLSIFPEPHISLSDDDELTLQAAPSRGKIKISRSLDNMMCQLDFDIDMIESLAARRNEEKVEPDADLSSRAVCFLRLSPAEIQEAKKRKGSRVWDSDRAEYKEIGSEEREEPEGQEKDTTVDNINERLRRSDRDVTKIDSKIKANVISERFLKKLNMAEINRLKVNTVDVGIQVNTLSRKWLNTQSSLKLNHGKEGIPPKISVGIIDGTYNASAQSNMPYSLSDNGGIRTPEPSFCSIPDDLRLRKKMSKKSVSFVSGNPFIQAMPSSPPEKRSKSQGVTDDSEERKMAAKPPIPPKKSSSSFPLSVEHANGDENPLKKNTIHDVRAKKSVDSVPESAENSDSEKKSLKNIEELCSAEQKKSEASICTNMERTSSEHISLKEVQEPSNAALEKSEDSISTTTELYSRESVEQVHDPYSLAPKMTLGSISTIGECTSCELKPVKRVHDPLSATPKRTFGSVSSTVERTSGEQKSVKQVHDPPSATPKRTLGSVSATAERTSGEQKVLKKVHNHSGSSPKKTVGFISAIVERTSDEQKYTRGTHGNFSSLQKKSLGSPSVERNYSEHKPFKRTQDHPSAVPRKAIRSVSPTSDHICGERRLSKKLEKTYIPTKSLRGTSPSGNKQKG